MYLKLKSLAGQLRLDCAMALLVPMPTFLLRADVVRFRVFALTAFSYGTNYDKALL